jgi:predicted nucleic acid-binding protein
VSTIYLETSAALTWLLGQPRASEVIAAVDGAEVVVTSSLTFAEIERALLRAEHDRVLRGADAQRLRGLMTRAGASWIRMAVGDDVLARASRPFPVEPVRTLDAIHLATALEFTRAFPEIAMLSLDGRILDNARSLGLGLG